MSSTSVAHWRLLNKSSSNGHAQCISDLYRASRPDWISCWHIMNAIELRLPWVGLCLSCKELCQDEIKFYKSLHGWGSHCRASIFQRAIMLGWISKSCKIYNIFFCVTFCWSLLGMLMRGVRIPYFNSCRVWSELEMILWSQQKLLWAGGLLFKLYACPTLCPGVFV